MKNPDHLLNRIFSLSRRAPEQLPSELPFGLETAVLAHWRSSSEGGGNAGRLQAFRWAATCACAVAIALAGLQHEELTHFSRGSDLQTRIADSAVAAAFNYE